MSYVRLYQTDNSVNCKFLKNEITTIINHNNINVSIENTLRARSSSLQKYAYIEPANLWKTGSLTSTIGVPMFENYYYII